MSKEKAGAIMDQLTVERRVETVPVSVGIVRFEGGTYDLEIAGLEGTLLVREAFATSFRVTGLKIDPQVVNPNVVARVSATMTNERGFVGTDSLTLRVDGVVAETRRVWLGPGVSDNVTFELVLEKPGDYTVGINGVIGQLIVARVFPLWLLVWSLVAVGLLAGTTVFARRRFGVPAGTAGGAAPEGDGHHEPTPEDGPANGTTGEALSAQPDEPR